MLAWWENGRSQAGVFQFYDYVELSVGINEHETALEFSIYPNPSNGSFSLASETEEQLSIRIMDVSGKVIQSEVLSGSTLYNIDLQTARAGMYIMEIETSEGRGFKRLIKN